MSKHLFALFQFSKSSLLFPVYEERVPSTLNLPLVKGLGVPAYRPGVRVRLKKLDFIGNP